MFRTQQSSSTLLMGPAGTSWFWASRPMAGKRKHQIDGGEGGTVQYLQYGSSLEDKAAQVVGDKDKDEEDKEEEDQEDQED